jgi:raffinose/stachyose/melibiose transport system permease protein
MKTNILKRISVFKTVILVLSLIYTISLLLPMIWGIFASLKSVDGFRHNILWLPEGWPWQWQWSNFSYVLENFYVATNDRENVPVKVGIGAQIINTILYAGVGSVISAFIPCVVAYMVERFDYKFSKFIYVLVITTMVLPIVGAYPSEIQLLNNLGLYNSIWGNWVQRSHFISIYFLVYHSSFKMISKEFSEAAYIDGASEFTVLFKINFALVRNVYLSIVLIKFIEAWNDYQIPLLYMPSYPTLAYGIWYLSNSFINGLSNVPMRMTGCIIMVVPILCLFIFLKDKIMGNVSMGGLKE